MHAPAGHQPAPTQSNAGLMQYLGDQSYVTADAAFRAVHTLWKGAIFTGDFDALAQALADGGIISAGWNLSHDTYVDRAAVGFMVARAVGVRTGVNWQLTGLGRYAWRELQFRGIAGPGSEWGLISGGEMQGVLARADEYAQRRGLRADERVQLGAETSTPPARSTSR
ncbi:MAG: hypothetical protein U1D55_08440 [Phycisphaerae bacterium]